MNWTLARTDHPDAGTRNHSALLHCTVRPRTDQGRALLRPASNSPWPATRAFHATSLPGDGQVHGVFTGGYVLTAEVAHTVRPDGTRVDIPAPGHPRGSSARSHPTFRSAAAQRNRTSTARSDRGSRSGDKWRNRPTSDNGAHRRPVALAGPRPHRRETSGSCCPKPPGCRSPGICCPTCGR